MNSNRSSSPTAFLVALSLLVLAVSTGAAVTSTASGVPEDARVGSKQGATYTLNNLYEDNTREWTLTGRTSMTGVQWIVEKRKLGGDVETESFSGQSFSTTVSSENSVETVVVTVNGTVPEISNFSYDPRERFVFAQLHKSVGNSKTEVTTTRVHHYTKSSRQARQAIENASEAIQAVGGDEQANRTLHNAISSYEAADFDNAIDLANQAEQRARQAERASQRTQLALYGGIGVVGLVAVFGGVYYWRSRQDTYDKLR